MTTSIIYAVNNPDARHSHRGIYVDVAGSFELPVGPFWSRDVAAQFVLDNAERLTELYGHAAASLCEAAS